MSSRILQAIRKHVPLVKFTHGKNQNIGVSHQPVSSQSKINQSTTALNWDQLPQKYKYSPLSQKEMDLIERGGAF